MGEKEYLIREFSPGDLEAVISINRENLPENYPAFFFKLHHENFPKAFLVAEHKGKIVGYIMCRVETGKLHTTGSIGRQGHIISIAVIPEMRRRGIGKNLMLKAMEALRHSYSVDEYYLEVRVNNTPAINLYTKLGFKPVKVLKGYYLDGEDAYLMAKLAP
ncbi:MAG: ribosomal protein S18-alanine N-acetyltransferase [Thermofilaceae archaeon]|nr:ribosomal protein S18-alanine N-acetyltransferase [Thermofilaceae archaeon]MDW8003657.1 ribosomal protein S18-alanine N-acetyltransferase [Thermofilaceae archaeon]